MIFLHDPLPHCLIFLEIRLAAKILAGHSGETALAGDGNEHFEREQPIHDYSIYRN